MSSQPGKLCGAAEPSRGNPLELSLACGYPAQISTSLPLQLTLAKNSLLQARHVLGREPQLPSLSPQSWPCLSSSLKLPLGLRGVKSHWEMAQTGHTACPSHRRVAPSQNPNVCSQTPGSVRSSPPLCACTCSREFKVRFHCCYINVLRALRPLWP